MSENILKIALRECEMTAERESNRADAAEKKLAELQRINATLSVSIAALRKQIETLTKGAP